MQLPLIRIIQKLQNVYLDTVDCIYSNIVITLLTQDRSDTERNYHFT